MLVSNIPQKIPVPWATNALSPYIRPIPATSQVAIQNGAASWPDGFPAFTFQPNGFPFGQDFNGVLQSITSWLRWANAGGPITWDAAFSTGITGYPIGAILQAAGFQGNFWFNTVDGNLTNPDQGGAGWIGFSLAIPTALIHYGVDTGSADAIAANVNPAVSSYQSGMIFEISAAAANLTPTPTANIQGLGAKTIQRWDGSVVQPSDILPAPVKTLLSCDTTANKLYLLNPGNLLKAPPLLIAPRTYFVNSTTGNDSNNGLTSGTAFATLQKAENTIAGINTNGFAVTVNVADGTYGGVVLAPLNGSGSVNYVGDVTTPANCIIAGVNMSAIAANQVQNHSFTGFTLASTGTSSIDPLNGLWLDETVVTLGNINFSQCLGGHINITAGGQVAFGASAVLTISGGCPGSTLVPAPAAHITVFNGGTLTILGSQPPSITITVGVTIGIFVQAAEGGSIGLFYSSITGAANVTATKKYNAFLNGTINSGGNGINYFPGPTNSGTTTSGGQYI